MDSTERARRLLVLGVPFGIVSGLLGIGTTEPRAPWLRAISGYSEDRVAPFNLGVTFMALGGAVIGRGPHTPASGLSPFLPEVVALLAGAVLGLVFTGRYAGARGLGAVERCTRAALVALGAGLVCAPMLPGGGAGLPFGAAVRVPAGLGLGLLVGVACRAQRVSGVDLLIPALVLAFGVDVKLAGSAAACAALPLVAGAVVRRTRTDPHVRDREHRELTLPMGLGGAAGAVAGGQLMARAPSSMLMLALGGALIASAVASFRACAEAELAEAAA